MNYIKRENKLPDWFNENSDVGKVIINNVYPNYDTPIVNSVNYRLLKFKTSPEWINFCRYFKDSNFLEQVGLYRYEDASTNFLYSLLKEDNIYDLGIYPFKLFVQLLATLSPNNFPNYKYDDENDIILTRISTQFKLNQNLRPDMIIEFSLNSKEYLICVEAKLLTTEHDNQCINYQNYIDENYPEKNRVYVYISLQNQLISSKDYIQITYQELIDFIYNPCLLFTNNSPIINEYLKSFISLYNIDWIEKNPKIIPITYDEKKLTIALYNKYKELLPEIIKDKGFTKSFAGKIFLCNLLKLNDELSIEEQLNQQIIESVLKSTYKCVFNNQLMTNSQCLYYVVKDIIKRHNITNYEELVNNGLIINVASWPIIISEKDIDSFVHKDNYKLGDEPIVIGNDKYYCCNLNTLNDMEKFIERVIDIYPEYKDQLYIKYL